MLYMGFKELVEKRCSVRQYTAEGVSEAALGYIMECARMAPSAVNFQPWHFYVVRSEEARAAVQQSYDREWFKTAPLYIVCTVCHDEEWVRQSDGKPHGNIDIAIAVEHICLAAAEQGLGTCWVCNFNAAMLSESLSLPANQEPAVIIAMGHPAVPVAEKKRKNIDEIVTLK